MSTYFVLSSFVDYLNSMPVSLFLAVFEKPQFVSDWWINLHYKYTLQARMEGGISSIFNWTVTMQNIYLL